MAQFCTSTRSRASKIGEDRGTLTIRETADGIKQGFGFGDTLTEERLPPSRRPKGSPKQLETGGPTPVAPRKIRGRKRMRGGAWRNDLDLFEVDFQTHLMRPETNDARKQRTAGTSAQAIIEEERRQVDAPGVENLGDASGLRDNWVDGKCDQNRRQGVLLLYVFTWRCRVCCFLYRSLSSPLGGIALWIPRA